MQIQWVYNQVGAFDVDIVNDKQQIMNDTSLKLTDIKGNDYIFGISNYNMQENIVAMLRNKAYFSKQR